MNRQNKDGMFAFERFFGYSGLCREEVENAYKTAMAPITNDYQMFVRERNTLFM